MPDKKLKIKNPEAAIINYWKWIIPAVSVILIVVVLLFIIKKPKPVFDGDRAYKELVKQVCFGPRISGSEGHEKQKNI